MLLRKLSAVLDEHKGEEVQNRRKRKHRKMFKNRNLSRQEITV